MMYIIIKHETVYHEGDGRSRTHPGHGYPAHTTNISVAVKLSDENQVKYWIQRNPNVSFELFKAEPVKVKTETQVSFE